jgi:hypothetical protein
MRQVGMDYWDHNIATGHTYKCDKKEWVTGIITYQLAAFVCMSCYVSLHVMIPVTHSFWPHLYVCPVAML